MLSALRFCSDSQHYSAMKLLALALMLAITGSAAEWYVDAARGNDENAGTSAEMAFRTIERLRREAITSGDHIRLARGSHWREQLSGLPPAVTIEAYGEGNRPLLDASDIVPVDAWQQQGTLYVVSWPHQLKQANKIKFSVWEDGLRMKRASSVEEARATPGSFWAPEPVADVNASVFVHPRDGNPVTNGHLYEISRREHGLAVSNGSQAIGIHTRRNGHNDGSLVGESNVVFRDCVAEDGTVHNVFLNSGLVEDVVAIHGEVYPGPGSSSLFVSYAKAATGLGVIYRRAKAVGGDPARPGEVGGVVGFLQHTTSTTEHYAHLVYESCEVSNVSVGFAGVAQNIVISGGVASKAYHAISVQALKQLSVLGFRADGMDETTPMNRVIYGNSPSTWVLQLDAQLRDASGAMIWMNGNVEVSQSKLIFSGSTRSNSAIRVDEGSLKVADVQVQGAAQPFELGPGVSLEQIN